MDPVNRILVAIDPNEYAEFQRFKHAKAILESMQLTYMQIHHLLMTMLQNSMENFAMPQLVLPQLPGSMTSLHQMTEVIDYSQATLQDLPSSSVNTNALPDDQAPVASPVADEADSVPDKNTHGAPVEARYIAQTPNFLPSFSEKASIPVTTLMTSSSSSLFSSNKEHESTSEVVIEAEREETYSTDDDSDHDSNLRPKETPFQYMKRVMDKAKRRNDVSKRSRENWTKSQTKPFPPVGYYLASQKDYQFGYCRGKKNINIIVRECNHPKLYRSYGFYKPSKKSAILKFRCHSCGKYVTIWVKASKNNENSFQVAVPRCPRHSPTCTSLKKIPKKFNKNSNFSPSNAVNDSASSSLINDVEILEDNNAAASTSEHHLTALNDQSSRSLKANHHVPDNNEMGKREQPKRGCKKHVDYGGNEDLE